MTGTAGTVIAAWGATIAIETLVLWLMLSARHDRRVRLFSGCWLSGCTLPVVWLVVPQLLDAGTPRAWLLLIAESATLALKWGLFSWAFIRPLPADARATRRDLGAIAVANPASFVLGETAWRVAGLARRPTTGPAELVLRAIPAEAMVPLYHHTLGPSSGVCDASELSRADS